MKPHAALVDLVRQADSNSANKDYRGGPPWPPVFVKRKGLQKQVKYQQKYLSVVPPVLLVASPAFGWTQAAVPAATRALSTTEQQLVDGLSLVTIKDTVNALAADDMQGRGTGQPGGDKAAAWIADRFAKLGLKPLGANNSFLQPIKFRETQFLPQTAFTIGNQSLKMGSEFFVMPPYSGDENVNSKIFF